MTEDERAAREWFRNYIRAGWMYPRADTGGHLLVIERLLNRKFPRGEDVPDDVVEKMWEAYHDYSKGCFVGMRAAIDVLHKHLTAPAQPKKVGAWAVKWPDGTHTVYTAQGDAIRAATEGSRIVRLAEAADADQ